jgi:hypothetical protein
MTSEFEATTQRIKQRLAADECPLPDFLAGDEFFPYAMNHGDSHLELIEHFAAIPDGSLLTDNRLFSDHTNNCLLWCDFAYLFMLTGRYRNALDILDNLYGRLLSAQESAKTRTHKGMPLFHMSQCYREMNFPAYGKRYMMLTLVEDAVSGSGELNLWRTLSYMGLSRDYGLPDIQICRYAKESFTLFGCDEHAGACPEWILQRLDQRWKTEIPSAQDAGQFRVSPNYCRYLASRLHSGDGKALEELGEYLIGSMPGCRTNRRARTNSGEFDIVVSVSAAVADFRSELGRYFVCECKDITDAAASFTDIAKFCRVLDSVKAKFGVIFSPTGHSGKGQFRDADREIQKLYQDRGIVIVVVDDDDIEQVIKGENFIELLREKYEEVRLDLKGSPRKRRKSPAANPAAAAPNPRQS